MRLFKIALFLFLFSSIGFILWDYYKHNTLNLTENIVQSIIFVVLYLLFDVFLRPRNRKKNMNKGYN